MNYSDEKHILMLVKRYEAAPDDYWETDEYDAICEYYIRMAQLTKAIQVAKKGIALHKQYTPLYYFLAQAYLESNQYASAIRSINIACKQYTQKLETIPPKYVTEIKHYLYESYALKTEIYIRQKNFPQAMRLLNKAIALLSDETLAYAMKAQVHYLLGQHAKAIDQMELIAKLEPYDAEHWYRLALAYREINDTVQAENAFTYTITLNPSHKSAWYQMAMMYLEDDAFAKAIECLQEYDKIEPNDLVIQLNWVICERQLGQYEQAMQRCEKLEKLYPEETEIQVEKGIILQCMERYTEAYNLFFQLKDDPNNVFPLFYLSKICSQTNQLDQAIHFAKELTAKDPKAARWVWLGTLYLHNEDFQNCLQAFLTAKLLDAQYPCIDLHIALAYQTLGEEDKSIEYIQYAIQKDPESIIQFMKEFPDIADNLPLSGLDTKQ